MDTLKDFFDEVKIRLANPLLGSFLIAWLLINYPIPLTLLFYQQAELKFDGYHSYLDVIVKHSNWRYLYFYPLVFALSYTFLFPYIKAYIQQFHAKITIKSEHRILEDSKTGSMPIAKFLKLKAEYDTQLTDLRRIVENESEILLQNATLIDQKNTLQQAINKLNEEKSKLSDQEAKTTKANTVNVLSGDWIYSSKSFKCRWKIYDGAIEIVSGPGEGTIYKIEDYIACYPYRNYAFTCRVIDPHIPYKLETYFLRERDGKFRGRLNGDIEFSLSKEDGTAWKI